ncbi:MAG TPA: efflux RND transporter periplasmic adaptor subunit [Deltaproteobacteria bacterium]|nr:efflux RND transporter periplasmic adaptor subunit [Deltaproteobacteria bacterium]
MIFRNAMAIAVSTALLVGCGDVRTRQEGLEPDRKVLFYKSPMDPSFIATEPGKDSMGMELVPVYEGDPAANLDQIEVTGATMQAMGVRLAPVKRDVLTRRVRAFGQVEVDETRIATVNMKFDGWIEKLYVDETGQAVEAGDPLFGVYSPELLATQKEYLQLLDGGTDGPHAAHLKRAARDRLLQFDVPESFIRRIEKDREPRRLVTFTSPTEGYVVHKNALEGTFVKRGANLFTVADLDALWIQAEIFEFDAPWVQVGQKATVEFDYLRGSVQEAEVEYIYPILDSHSRTVQARLVLPNPDVAVKPGMFATVRIQAQPVGETLVVPTEAVIHSGERNIAFVSRGVGLFEGRELELGVRGNEVYEVLSGLEEGEQVVVSGQFLIDSESRLKEAVKKMLGTNVGSSLPSGGSSPEMDMDEPAVGRGAGGQ